MVPVLIIFVTFFAVKGVLVFKPNLPYAGAILMALNTASIVCAALYGWQVLFGGR
ncbi:MAG TPA: hypothetical protein VFT99_12650 [Roseiflexaceae bacterium]|nr:hypothetical protein [Roseiflexaceae bacterium]